MMPVNAQLGNISYAVCALVGAAMAVGGVSGMTLGTVVAFLLSLIHISAAAGHLEGPGPGERHGG